MRQLVSLASKRQTLPILNTVLVRKGVAMATDLDGVIEHPVRDIKDGLYQSHGFADPGLRVKSTMSPQDFPDPFPLGDKLGEMEVDISTLQFVGKAMSSEETRYYLNGIAFFHDCMVATDGHRLNLAKIKAGTLSHKRFNEGIILPRFAIKQAIAAAKEKRLVRCRITLFEKGSQIVVGKYRISAKNIEGTYPDYKRVMPEITGETLKTRFIASQFEPIRDAVRTIMKQEDKTIPALTLYNGTAFFGDHRWPVVAKFRVNIGFNARYLPQVTSGELYYTNDTSPVRIINEKLGYESVLMPMRI